MAQAPSVPRLSDIKAATMSRTQTSGSSMKPSSLNTNGHPRPAGRGTWDRPGRRTPAGSWLRIGTSMRALARLLLGLVMGLALVLAWAPSGVWSADTWATADPASATSAMPPTATPRTVMVFVREGCPHCTDAKAWL